MTDRKKLIKKLDEVFSQWIRRRDADYLGQTACYTCGTVKPWKEMHAGHFMSRGKWSTRYHEQNVQPQCVGCNIFRSGEQYKFGVHLDAQYGQGTADKLEYLSNQTGKYPKAELERLIEVYKQRLSELE